MDNWCKGCKFHNFPYKALPPILIDGKRVERTFTCKEDVYEIVELLIKETEDFNIKGKSFDVALSISKQIPFFSCINILYNQESQKDIEKYLYCREFGISPYSGPYSNQPKRWVDRVFFIKKALAKKEKSMIDKQNKEAKNG
tara:strand:+ start:321 stop:746 length:426 start_codon:yes stop_codon:yes gene_type:complete